MRRHTIVIATESAIIASGLQTLLSGLTEMAVEAKHLSADSIFNFTFRYQPAAIIADMADASILAALQQCRDELKTVPAIIGFYHSALPPATTRLVNGTFSIYDSVETLKKLLKRNISDNNDEATSDLTPREKEVIRGIVKGLSNKEIASKINVSVNTVMTHRRNIASKLKIHSPAGLTIFAIVSKLVSLDEIKDQMETI